MNKRAIRLCETCGHSAHFLDGGSNKYCKLHKGIFQGSKTRSFEDLTDPISKKRCLIREGGWHCWICQNETWQNKQIPLQLDHIDGDRNNNTRMNLRIVCPNCHAQTDTFCGKNKGKCSSPRNRTRA